MQIPKANLSNCICGNVDFRGADLTEAQFAMGYFTGCKFQGANLTNAVFGEKPPILVEQKIHPIDQVLLVCYTFGGICSHCLYQIPGKGVLDYCLQFAHPSICRWEEPPSFEQTPPGTIYSKDCYIQVRSLRSFFSFTKWTGKKRRDSYTKEVPRTKGDS